MLQRDGRTGGLPAGGPRGVRSTVAEHGVLACLVAALAGAPAGCGGGRAHVTSPEPSCPEPQEWESGADGADDLAVPPRAGHAVAGRITAESQLLAGLKPRGRVGDFLLANDRIAVVVEDARPSDGYGSAGGEILDVDLVEPEGPTGESLFGELLLGVLPEILAPEQVSVLADGSDGGPAIVRAAGRLAPLWMVQDCCADLMPRPIGLAAAVDYVLEPGSPAVEVRITLRNDSVRVLRPESGLVTLVTGDGGRRYVPGAGFSDEPIGESPYVGIVGDRISYAWIPVQGQVRHLAGYEGFNVYDVPAADLPECAATTITLGLLAVAGGDASRIQAVVREARAEPQAPALTGLVTEPDGSPVAAARVHLTDREGEHLSMGRTGEDGSFRIEIEPGTYVIQAWADDRRPSAAAEVVLGAGGASQDLEMPPAGVLAWTVRDASGGEIPAKVSVLPLDEPAPVAPESFGEWSHPAGAVHHAFSLPRRTEARLPVGRYRVVASRGFEYEIDEREVEVTTSATAEVELVLFRSVDTTGWVTGDFHIHTMYSPDSNDLVEWKVAASAAVGLEIPVVTDHRWVSDLQPTVERLGLERWVHWFPGQEVTTFRFGHFNSYPRQAQPDLPNDGAVEESGHGPLDLLRAMREVPGEPIIQINHPRGAAAGAYFSYVGLDPATLEVELPEDWTTDFDAIEVWNGSDWLDNLEESGRDWLGMLAHGIPVTATGNSDSHTTEWHDIGYPRNYLQLGTDDPTEVTAEMLRDAVRQGGVVVSGGLFVTVESRDGVGPGGVAAAPAGAAVFTVRVQAPTWMDADQVEVFVDGVSAQQIALDESTEDPENPVARLDRELSFEVEADASVVVAAWSEGTVAPASSGGRPFGVTNALFFDADGDGEYRDTGRMVE